jgi:signal transduction histidine kinase
MRSCAVACLTILISQPFQRLAGEADALWSNHHPANAAADRHTAESLPRLAGKALPRGCRTIFHDSAEECPNRRPLKSCVQAKIVQGESPVELMIPRLDRSSLRRYAVAVLSAGAAAGLTVAIEPLFHGKEPLFFFIVAALVSAAFGGLGPGLVTTGLGLAIIVAFFQPDVLVLSVAHSSLIVFVVLGVGISVVMGHLRRNNAALVLAKERLQSANEKLSERGKALAQANEELQRFAYAVAHDLSTPLRGISTLTELLVQRNLEMLDESSKECAQMIVTRVQRTLSMIKGLLDYAAAGEQQEERALVDCGDLVKRAVEDLDSAIKECGAEITVDPLPSIPATGSHLVQVFSNLIGNALKYRPSVRQPQVQISASERGDDWAFCVRDNGIGLDMQYADEIFGMFRRLHPEGSYPGNGIGLALCKMIVERHSGRIWVESEIGKGCRFFFTIPKNEKPSADRNAAKALTVDGTSPSA